MDQADDSHHHQTAHSAFIPFATQSNGIAYFYFQETSLC